MADKKKPLKKSGNQQIIEGADYSNTRDYKQRLVRKFPIIRLYAPIFPADAQEDGIHDVNDLVNYQRRKAEEGRTND